MRAIGVTPVVVDVFDADAVAQAVAAARPDIVIHQLTDLSSAPGTPGYPAAQEANRRLRIEGTANLMRAARLAGVGRAIAQSIAFVYAPGEGTRSEDDPLDVGRRGGASGDRAGHRGARTRGPGNTRASTGVVLRYGYLYGPDTWYEAPPKPPSVHVDAAAHAAWLAMNKGAGIYNIAEDDGAVAIAKAVRELGFDPAFRMT